MNWKFLLALVLVIAGLGAYLLYQGGQTGEPQAAADEADYPIPYAPEDVRRVHVVYQDTAWLIARDGAEWLLESPPVAPKADSLTINHLLRTLHETPVMSSIPVDELDLEAVGLADPVLVFTAVNAAGDSTRLEFGSLNPTTENIYVRDVGADRVLLVNRLMGPMMTVNGFLIRGKGLHAVNPYRAVRIERETGGRTVFRAVRRGIREPWKIVLDGDSLSADKRRINIRLSELYAGQVRDFLPVGSVSEAETGLNSPLRRLIVAGADGDSSVIDLGRISAETDYLRWARSSLYPDFLLLVDSWLIERLDDFNPDSMRSLELTEFLPAEVDFISLSNPLDSLVLTAENDTLWNLVAPQRHRADFFQVSRLLVHADTMTAVRSLRAGEGRGFESPQLRLVLGNGDSLVADLVVGDFGERNTVYIRDRLRNVDFIASPRIIEPLNLTYKDVAEIAVRHVVE